MNQKEVNRIHEVEKTDHQRSDISPSSPRFAYHKKCTGGRLFKNEAELRAAVEDMPGWTDSPAFIGDKDMAITFDAAPVENDVPPDAPPEETPPHYNTANLKARTKDTLVDILHNDYQGTLPGTATKNDVIDAILAAQTLKATKEATKEAAEEAGE